MEGALLCPHPAGIGVFGADAGALGLFTLKGLMRPLSRKLGQTWAILKHGDLGTYKALKGLSRDQRLNKPLTLREL